MSTLRPNRNTTNKYCNPNVYVADANKLECSDYFGRHFESRTTYAHPYALTIVNDVAYYTTTTRSWYSVEVT